MPPKRKPRLPSRATSTPSGDIVENLVEEVQTPMKQDVAKVAIVSDSWTDEQETSLFKGMIRWKPVGMHKHFRMVAISQHLRNHGYTSQQDDHTRIPYIWDKLRNLYNLDALDERENFFGDLRTDDEVHTKDPFCQFSLPDDEFGEMMFAKRLAPEGSFSPLSLQRQPSGESDRRQSTIDDTDDPHSSPASAVGQRPSRGTRGSRRSQLQAVAPPLVKPKVDDATEDDQKETKEKAVDKTGNADDIRGNGNASKAVNNKAKKRRSGRRR
ncbi:hypothetical protein MMC07_006865 [Pseudocyphellaria aurata]|nr:hypothetical protein [Pseudocyphellaria aurata]